MFYKVGEEVCKNCKAVDSIYWETTPLEPLGVIGRSKTESVCRMCGFREDWSYNTWTTNEEVKVKV